MTIRTREIASQYGALDSGAIADGEAAHAHVLRELSRNANRLATMGQPLQVWCWDASPDLGDAATVGGMAGYARADQWNPVTDGTLRVRKKPNLRKADCYIWLDLTGTTTAWVQVITNAYRNADGTPRLNAIGSANVKECTSAGAGFELYALTDIALGPGEFEDLELWILGQPGTTDPGSTYGTPTSGTPEEVTESHMIDTAGQWYGPGFSTTTPTLADSGAHFLRFLDSSSNVIAERKITSVAHLGAFATFTAYGRLGFHPRLPTHLATEIHEQSRAGNYTYVVRQANTYRFASVALYAQDGVL